MIREKISEKVHLTQIPSEKFKRNRVSVTFIMPNDRDKATMYALLPGLMERAYRDYPEMRLFSRKLAKMYSTVLSAGTAVVGANRTVRFTVQGIKNQYCLEGENLLDEMCNVLIGSIFRPCLEDGAFIPEWVEVEKFKLREDIESEINDKRSYCIKNAKRKFYGDSAIGVERLGYLEEIDSITPQNLYNCYKEMLDKAVIEIFVTADNPETCLDTLKSAFCYERSARSSVIPVSAIPCAETVGDYSESFDTVQGKVCLIYTVSRVLTEAERYHMLVASALYGGTPSSRLFKNVREKQSLCYYCRAGFNGFSQSMTVDSGVEHRNAQKTIDAVQTELKNLITGEITQKEIDDVKRTLKTSINSNYDSLYGLEAWYLNEAIRGTEMSPSDVLGLIERVTEEDIRKVLSLLNLNVIYRITK